MIDIARQLFHMGFGIVSTVGTARALEENGVQVTRVFRLSEGRPNVIDMIKNDNISLIINTASGTIPRKDENLIRTEAVKRNISIFTTISGARAAVDAIRAVKQNDIVVRPVQDYAQLLNA